MRCNENEYEIIQVSVHHSLAKYSSVLPSRVRGNIVASVKNTVTCILVILKINKYIYIYIYIYKVKQSRYRPGVAQRVPGS